MVKRNKRIFPGWYVAATLSLCGVTLYGVGFYSFIVFVNPLADEFHWSQASLGWLVSAFWIAAPLVLVSDPIIRKFGTRRLLIAGVLIESACLIMLFSASSFWQLYLLRVLAGIGKIFYAITIPVVLSRWFSRNFAVALALVYCGWHIGGLMLAPLAQALISNWGWRSASVVLGCSILVALPPILWFLRAPSAEALGYNLDGYDDQTSSVKTDDRAMQVTSATLQENLRLLAKNRSFLLLVLGIGMYTTVYCGVLAHQAAALQAAGVSAGTASMIVGLTAGCAVLGAPMIGWLMSRFALRTVTLVQYALKFGGIACLLGVTAAPTMFLMLLHAVLFGLAVGGCDPFWIPAVKRYLSAESFSTGYGIFYFSELVGLIVGPGLAGLVFDLSGTYRGSLGGQMVLLLVPFVFCLILAKRDPENAPFRVSISRETVA